MIFLSCVNTCPFSFEATVMRNPRIFPSKESIEDTCNFAVLEAKQRKIR